MPPVHSTTARLSSTGTALLERIQQRRARVGVVGLGYVGLPLAVEFARSGLRTVTGIDLDAAQGRRDQRGHVLHPRRAHRATSRSCAMPGACSATTDFAVVGELDTINICVPTPLRKTKDPDMSYIVVGGRSRSPSTCIPGMLVILESTTYPGHDRGSWCSRCSKRPASRPASTSSSRSRPSASIRATRRSTRRTCRRSSAA